jgi:hypothetical protein
MKNVRHVQMLPSQGLKHSAAKQTKNANDEEQIKHVHHYSTQSNNCDDCTERLKIHTNFNQGRKKGRRASSVEFVMLP